MDVSIWLERAETDAKMYIDYVHYSPAFSDRIARLLADAAFERLTR